MLRKLALNAKFWLAVVALVKAIINSIPGVSIPDVVMAAADALIAVVIAAVAVDEVGTSGSVSVDRALSDGVSRRRVSAVAAALVAASIAIMLLVALAAWR